jgi:putative ATP-binding cassette transporter
LKNVLRAWRDICKQTMKTTIVSQTSGFVAPILPVLLCAPKYLDGSMSLGQVMQAASAFTIVQAAFNWLVDNYPRLADWTASARRVSTLMLSLDALEKAERGGGINRIVRSEDGERPRCGCVTFRSRWTTGPRSSMKRRLPSCRENAC